MKTNKPTVIAWASSLDLAKLSLNGGGRNGVGCILTDGPTPHGNDAAMVRLAGYEALQAECEKLRKDAERYRWLRDNCEMTADEYGTAGQLYFGTYQAGRLDEAIDAAMQETNP